MLFFFLLSIVFSSILSYDANYGSFSTRNKNKRGRFEKKTTRYTRGGSHFDGLSFSTSGNYSNNPLNVMDFGAVPDGKTDCSKAFLDALSQASKTNGNKIFVPTGNYLITQQLTIPANTILEGIFSAPITGQNRGGSVILTSYGLNQEDDHFIGMQINSAIKGLQIFYPDQPTKGTPKKYAWTIQQQGDNVALIDVQIVNPWNGVDFGKTVEGGRHFISGLYGQPLNIGVYIDKCYDIGRLEDIHFWPFYSNDLVDYTKNNAVAFVFARTDWEYVFNTFVFGYKIGYHFIESEHGACNGNFLGIGADLITDSSLKVEHTQLQGLLFVNGEFTAFQGSDSTQVRVMDTNEGAVRFSNCAFWGPTMQIAKLSGKVGGKSTVGFDNCVFSDWDHDGTGRYAIQATGGNLQVTNCDFQKDGNQVSMSGGVSKATILANIFNGKERIQNQAKNAQIGYNAAD